MHAVETELIQAVRRCFEREMRDALGAQFCQRLRQRHRVRRRQRAIDPAVGLDDADGAERRRLPPACRKNLAREFGHGGLAVRTRDRDDGLRSRAVKARRHQSQRPARRAGPQNQNAQRNRDRRPRTSQYHDRTLGDGIGDKAGAVRLGSGERREQEARPYGAAVGRDTGDVDISEPAVRRRLGPEEFGDVHGFRGRSLQTVRLPEQHARLDRRHSPVWRLAIADQNSRLVLSRQLRGKRPIKPRNFLAACPLFQREMERRTGEEAAEPAPHAATGAPPASGRAADRLRLWRIILTTCRRPRQLIDPAASSSGTTRLRI